MQDTFSPVLEGFLKDSYPESKNEKKESPPLEIEAKFMIRPDAVNFNDRQKKVLVNYYYEEAEAKKIAELAGISLPDDFKASIVRLRFEQTGDKKKYFVAIKDKKRKGTSTRIELEKEISEENVMEIAKQFKPISKLVKDKIVIKHDLQIDGGKSLPIKLEITRISEAGGKPVNQDDLSVLFIDVETKSEEDLTQVRKHIQQIDFMKNAVDVSTEKGLGMKNLGKNGVTEETRKLVEKLLK